MPRCMSAPRSPDSGARRRTVTLRSALARRRRQRHRTVRGIVLGRHRRRRRNPSRRFPYGWRGQRREDALGFPLHVGECGLAVEVVGQLDERAGAIRRRGERLDPRPQGAGLGAELGALAPDSVEHRLQFGCSRLGLRGSLRRRIPLRPRGAQVLVRDRALGGDVSRPLDLHPARRLVELALHLAELLGLAGELCLRGDDLLLRRFRPFDGGGELRAQRALALERGGEQGPRTAIAVRSLDLVRHRRLAAASRLELVLESRELRGDLRQLVACLLLQPLLLLGPYALARELLGALGAQPLQLLRTGMRAGQLLRGLCAEPSLLLRASTLAGETLLRLGAQALLLLRTGTFAGDVAGRALRLGQRCELRPERGLGDGARFGLDGELAEIVLGGLQLALERLDPLLGGAGVRAGLLGLHARDRQRDDGLVGLALCRLRLDERVARLAAGLVERRAQLEQLGDGELVRGANLLALLDRRLERRADGFPATLGCDDRVLRRAGFRLRGGESFLEAFHFLACRGEILLPVLERDPERGGLGAGDRQVLLDGAERRANGAALRARRHEVVLGSLQDGANGRRFR